MRPFDIDAAKHGAAVCTRDGRWVRILDFHLKSDRPICAAITNIIGNTTYEYTLQFFPDGRLCKRFVPKPGKTDIGVVLLIEDRNEDLMMA